MHWSSGHSLSDNRSYMQHNIHEFAAALTLLLRSAHLAFWQRNVTGIGTQGSGMQEDIGAVYLRCLLPTSCQMHPCVPGCPTLCHTVQDQRKVTQTGCACCVVMSWMRVCWTALVAGQQPTHNE
jgi:hypothetical protein